MKSIFTAVSTTATVACDSSQEAVESKNMISLADSKPCVRCMIFVTTNTAQQLPSFDLVVQTLTPASGYRREVKNSSVQTFLL